MATVIRYEIRYLDFHLANASSAESIMMTGLVPTYQKIINRSFGDHCIPPDRPIHGHDRIKLKDKVHITSIQLRETCPKEEGG